LLDGPRRGCIARMESLGSPTEVAQIRSAADWVDNAWNRDPVAA
jgi:hypothetical protein